MQKVSSSERKYIIDGVRQGVRADGRGRLDVRHIVLESGIIPQANGSARLSLANGSTDILAAVKVEVGEPELEMPDFGRVEVFVDVCPTVSARMIGREATEMSAEYTQLMDRLLRASSRLDLSELCIIPGKKVWVVYLDIMILDSGGNLPDLMSLAAYAALNNTLIPKVHISEAEDGEMAMEVEEDLGQSITLDAKTLPICVTLSQVGDYPFIADATPEEECCVGVRVTVAVDRHGHVCGMQKSGVGGMPFGDIEAVLGAAKSISNVLFTKLEDVLTKETSAEQGANVVIEKAGFFA